MPDLPDVRDDLSTFESAVERIHWYYRAEAEIFAFLGHMASEDIPGGLSALERVVYATQSRYHGFHAELWRELLPTPGQAFSELATQTPDSNTVLIGATGTSPELAGESAIESLYGELLPAVAHLYEGHLSVASRMTDGPIVRVLRLVLGSRASWSERPSGR